MLSPHFARAEFACKCCGEFPDWFNRQLDWPGVIGLEATPDGALFNQFVGILEVVRGDSPLRVTSWYRCAKHPIEAAKPKPGAHNTGLAVDIALSRNRALHAVYDFLYHAGRRPFKVGVGVKQRGHPRYLHLDIAGEVRPDLFRPTIWSY